MWKSTDGKEVKASIRSIDAGICHLQRTSDFKTFAVPLARFSDEDRRLINLASQEVDKASLDCVGVENGERVFLGLPDPSLEFWEMAGILGKANQVWDAISRCNRFAEGANRKVVSDKSAHFFISQGPTRFITGGASLVPDSPYGLFRGAVGKDEFLTVLISEDGRVITHRTGDPSAPYVTKESMLACGFQTAKEHGYEVADFIRSLSPKKDLGVSGRRPVLVFNFVWGDTKILKPGHALIGDKLEACKKLYGEPSSVTKGVTRFEKDGIFVTAEFTDPGENGRVYRISYTNTNNTFSTTGLYTLMVFNGRMRTWDKDPQLPFKFHAGSGLVAEVIDGTDRKTGAVIRSLHVECPTWHPYVKGEATSTPDPLPQPTEEAKERKN